MSVCRNDHTGVPGAAFDESKLQRFETRQDQPNGLAHKQPEIRGDLIISAAARMQFQCCGTDLGGKCGFDEGMNVFVRRCLDLVQRVVGENLLQALVDGFPFFLL